MIEARKVTKHFGRRTVLKELDLKIADGEIVALMGPNGAGKTTLLRVISTLTNASSGDVLIDGVSVYEDPVIARKKMGMVGHSTYTYDDLTALENLRFYWAMYGLPGKGFENVGQEMLRRVGLSHRMNDRAGVFSKGMRQRLALARAVMHSPKVLLLDEPFSSLDQKGIDVLNEILGGERARGASVLVVTHDVQRIAGLADRAVALEGGRIARSFDRDAIERGELDAWYRRSSEGGIA